MHRTLKVRKIKIGGIKSPVVFFKKGLSMDTGIEAFLTSKTRWRNEDNMYSFEVVELTPKKIGITKEITSLDFISKLEENGLFPLKREEIFYTSHLYEIKERDLIYFFTKRFPCEDGFSIPFLFLTYEKNKHVRTLKEYRLLNNAIIESNSTWLVRKEKYAEKNNEEIVSLLT